MQLQPNPLLIYLFQKPLAPGQVTFYNFLYMEHGPIMYLQEKD